MVVGPAVDGACKGEGEDGEGQDNHADHGRDHGMVHDGAVEAEQLALSVCGAEEPEAADLVVLVVAVNGLPLLLEVGHVGLEPVVVDNLAARGDGAVEVGGLGELLPLRGAVADGGGEGDGGALADVVELAAGHVGLGRGHVVVRGRAGRHGGAREQARRGVGGVVLVGRLHPRRQRVDGALPVAAVGGDAAARRGEGARRARDRVAVALADGDAVALAVARVARDGAHSGLGALGAVGRGGARRHGRGQQAVRRGRGRVRAEEGRGEAMVALSALGHGLAGHAGAAVRGVVAAAVLMAEPQPGGCACRRRGGPAWWRRRWWRRW